MDMPQAPKVAKTPFLIGDLMLAGFAGAVMYLHPHPLDVWPVLISGLALMGAAWLGVIPWIMQYRGALRMAEAAGLSSTVERIAKLEEISQQISGATAQWQTAHQMAGETTQTARQIVDRIGAEARAFAEVMQKTHEAEKQHLRLEVEKSRRMEGEWLKVATTMLDHTYALHQAGVRSGQGGLIEQLGHFQNACRDAARRVGLLAFAPRELEPYDARAHQPVEPNTPLPSHPRIERVIAVGYTYQGQVLRRAVVEIQADGELREEPFQAPASRVDTPASRTEPEEAAPAAEAVSYSSAAPAEGGEPPLAPSPKPSSPEKSELF